MIRQTTAFRWAVALVGALAGALLMPVAVGATPAPVAPPAIPGVPQLPGPPAPPATPSPGMGILSVSPDTGGAGTPVTISGSGLPASQPVTLTWSTSNVTWTLDARPDSVDYLGRSATNFPVVLANTTTDAKGSFSVQLKAPDDFGGIHDIYAVVGGAQVAHGGFLISRSATMTPRKGRVGTPITITYHGLGPSLYEGGASLLYDNHYAGSVSANWTRGTAKVTIRASGRPGKHTIEIADAITFTYLNIKQSPIPWATGRHFTFTVKKGGGLPKPSFEWPVDVAPTIDARTTLQSTGLAAGGAHATLAPTRGQVGDRVDVSASGLGGDPVTLQWSTVVGNRVNCKGTCWSFVSVPLGTATPSGGSLKTTVTVPDGLGGWHVVQLLQGGQVRAQVPFYVERSIVGDGVSSLVLRNGQPFTVHLKGLGWTQMDNTIAVDYDNSYIGYGCGFNSNGDVVMDLIATGGPGIHLIDMYPLLYTNQPSYANTPYGNVPFLTFAQDEPGLAAGYRLPAIRLAIRVVGPGGGKKHRGKKHRGKKHHHRGGKHAGHRRGSARLAPRLLSSG